MKVNGILQPNSDRTKSLDPSGIKVWVTPPSRKPQPGDGEVLAEGKENIEYE